MKNAKKDPVAQYNIERWAALARNRAVFTRPQLDLDAATARMLVDPQGRLGDLKDRPVLCLASGGGQQSVAFALLGANVTVVDLSAAQLEQDRFAAAHYGLEIQTVEADMRDLSVLAPSTFDLVYQPYSINFVPDATVVFGEVARLLREGGLYHFQSANPCFAGLLAESWDGQGYPLHLPYVQGALIEYNDEAWIFRGDTPGEAIHRPREYRHTLGTLINGLTAHGFLMVRLDEENLGHPDMEAVPGTTEHFTAVAPPWLRFWASFRPNLLGMPQDG
ncbi:MAG: methyltransferase domain-containing protein [Caldilineaceae bacterium]|nr:methyltransferase domain-containing protein [Caldilineaceae bacterium]